MHKLINRICGAVVRRALEHPATAKLVFEQVARSSAIENTIEDAIEDHVETTDHFDRDDVRNMIESELDDHVRDHEHGIDDHDLVEKIEDALRDQTVDAENLENLDSAVLAALRELAETNDIKGVTFS